MISSLHILDSPDSTCLAVANTDKPTQTGLTITTARKSVTGLVVQQTSTVTAPLRVNNKAVSSPGAPQSRPHAHTQPDDELTTVSSVSLDAIPGLRKQASVVDPEQKKQLEKGWGLSYKDPSAPVPVRKEVLKHCLWCYMCMKQASMDSCCCSSCQKHTTCGVTVCNAAPVFAIIYCILAVCKQCRQTYACILLSNIWLFGIDIGTQMQHASAIVHLVLPVHVGLQQGTTLPSSKCVCCNMTNMRKHGQHIKQFSQVEVSSPQQDTLERVRQLNTERQALAQQRAQAEHAKQVKPHQACEAVASITPNLHSSCKFLAGYASHM